MTKKELAIKYIDEGIGLWSNMIKNRETNKEIELERMGYGLIDASNRACPFCQVYVKCCNCPLRTCSEGSLYHHFKKGEIEAGYKILVQLYILKTKIAGFPECEPVKHKEAMGVIAYISENEEVEIVDALAEPYIVADEKAVYAFSPAEAVEYISDYIRDELSKGEVKKGEIECPKLN